MTPSNYRKLLNHIHKGEDYMSTKNGAPAGWIMTGESPYDYETGLDKDTVHNGHQSAYLKSKDKKARGFATLMQHIKAENYKGERIRFSGFVKTIDVEESAGLWMRIDHSSGEILAFDNMMNRPIKGTNEWNHYSVILDVPLKSETIAFGILLNGPGQIWIDELRFEIVDDSVSVTEQSTTAYLSEKPVNLNFENKE